jgi:hypothetical protein
VHLLAWLDRCLITLPASKWLLTQSSRCLLTPLRLPLRPHRCVSAA